MKKTIALVLVILFLSTLACSLLPSRTTPSPSASTVQPVSTSVPTDGANPTDLPPTATSSLNLLLDIGSKQTSPKDGMVMVFVPAGEFQMGSTEAQVQVAITACVKDGNSQSDCNDLFANEKPAHTVYLDSFWIDQTEVTNGRYAQCASAGGCVVPKKINSEFISNYYGDSQFTDYPVINIDWNQADAYCKWAGRRLPTEAQWEKAARGTDGRTYPWGEGMDCNKANYPKQDGFCGHEAETKVGSYPAGASPYGALDMAGNTWEWVADWYGPYSSSSQKNPQGPSTGEEKVLRGGIWYTFQYFGYRSANRFIIAPNYPGGIRCAVSRP